MDVKYQTRGVSHTWYSGVNYQGSHWNLKGGLKVWNLTFEPDTYDLFIYFFIIFCLLNGQAYM